MTAHTANEFLEMHVQNELLRQEAQRLMAIQVRDTTSMWRKLQSFWMERNLNMDRWQKTIRLDNYLEAPQMESFIANEPKTTFNLALEILSKSSIPHTTVKEDDLSNQQTLLLRNMERVIRKYWRHTNKWNIARGRKSWMREQIGYMLVTGWYSIYCQVDNDKTLAENWNPYNVYPWYDDDFGLLEVIHINSMHGDVFLKKIQMMGWPTDINIKPNEEIEAIDHFKIDIHTGIVWNGVVARNKVVKPWTPHLELPSIPVKIGPIGGFSDRGEMQSTKIRWSGTYGEGLPAANYHVQRNFNRQMSYLQQTMRDAANPRFWEKSQGSDRIIKPEDVFKRGAIFRMGLNEDVGVISPSGIPIEVSTSLQDINNMIAKGGFANTFFGVSNNTQSAIQTRAIIEGNQQVLGPFISAIEEAISAVDNYWANHVVQNGDRPWGITFNGSAMKSLSIDFEVKAFPKIPGDFVNRAQMAKILNPAWTMTIKEINSQLFPEITEPTQHQAQLRAERAMMNPAFADLDAIIALEEEADALEVFGETERATLFLSVAERIRQSLGARIEGSNPALDQIPPGTPTPIEAERQV